MIYIKGIYKEVVKDAMKRACLLTDVLYGENNKFGEKVCLYT